MNVWVALLNLEHKYGSHESVMQVLEKACQGCHPKHMHLHAVDMYDRAGQPGRAETLLEVREAEDILELQSLVWKPFLYTT